MRNKIIAGLVTVLSVLSLNAGSAFAWTYSLSGQGACQQDGSFKITWTINNSGESKAFVVTASDRAVVPVGTSVAKYTTQSYMETVSGTSAGSFTLHLSGNWPGGDSNTVSKYATVHLYEACKQPMPVNVPLCHTTDSLVYTKMTVTAEDAYKLHYKVDAGDIIPPFTYYNKSYSLNWDNNTTSQTIYRNDCKTGGSGGETPTTPVTPTVTPAATTTTVATPAPTGGVGAGEGGASQTTNLVSMVGLLGSLSAIGLGLRKFNQTN